ncbi:hypothetical protein DM02DRAFT_29961 [Periconia macrospinosa]|uniref:PHD-type domain-containing protein n=1 Tax=Periconia macrospinosa TaxID=97972 RepID=A0A2V1DKR6_9PLEO|nr:hypothetical protein DM02DRAFT_29961 [Periconia macrospinosa]
MATRKRGRAEMEADAPPEEPSTLQKLRNMWQFANLAQYLSLFKGPLKLGNDVSIEDLETECLQPQPSEKLAEIGLALLKHISSHKGLTIEIFDEYARRQYVAKAPLRNPFGTDEDPIKFNSFDIFTRIRVLQQLSIWTLNNPNTIRERMNITEVEMTDWRFTPFGWDAQERELYVLDDFRMYRRTEPQIPKPKPKPKSRKSRAKRRKVATPEPEEPTEIDDETKEEDDGFGGAKWECVCITFAEYQDYMANIKRSKDENEKNLYARLEEEIIPELSKAAEKQARKEAQRQKELETLQKLATAKRSSRISARQEKLKEVEQAEEAERRRKDELAKAKAEQEKQKQMEDAQESRRQTREQRIREREAAKILEEENLRKLQEEEEKLASGEARRSERYLREQMRKTQRQLKKLKEKTEWTFDCEKCGLSGANLNDGSHQIQCERCEVWQHSKCHNITPAEADKDEYVFLCTSCKRKKQGEMEPKLPPLKLRLTSTSPGSQQSSQPNGDSTAGPVFLPSKGQAAAQSPPRPVSTTSALMNGPSLSPRGQALGPPGIQRSEAAYGSPMSYANGGSSPIRPSHSRLNSGVHMGNGYPTSSPPRYQPSSPFTNNTSSARNGASFQNSFNASLTNSFNRPASASGSVGPFHSPVKQSPAPSPRPSNGMPNAYDFSNSPHSSFPPNPVQAYVPSPTKHSSPPPHMQAMSSPAPAPIQFSRSPIQMPAQVLPDPIPAPSKHDAARPVSSHEVSEKMILPPVKSLPPSTPFQDLSPPMKKTSPTPEKPQFMPIVKDSS